MIQTKEEMFLAELGINPKEEIEGLYGAKIKIIDLVKKYQAEQFSITDVGCSFCEEIPKDSFYLGTTCKQCNKPFRVVKTKQ
jgi:hypothetical protein